MADIAVFAFESSAVRMITRDGDPWFVAADIASILGYKLTTDMIKMLDEDERGMQNVHTLGGDQEMIVISESGLYAAILKSRRPEAKTFRKWVTAEVLPSIRRSGSYADPGRKANSPASPPFQAVNHQADILVSADRTFRAMLRSSRSAGLRLPQALQRANAITKRNTGIDMLEAVGVVPQENPAWDDDAGGIAAFAAAWLDGSLPLPATICKSTDLYAAYRYWRKTAGGRYTTGSNQFFPALLRADRVLRKSVIGMQVANRRISVRAVIVGDAEHRAPEGQRMYYVSGEVERFAAALADWISE